MNNKMKNASLITSAISLILLTSLPVSAESIEKEQCAGIVKGGFNDCASAEHICAGMNSEDGNSEDWLWLPKGTCQKILGGHVLVKIVADF